MKPVVIVPTYNERDNIDLLIEELLTLPENVSVINVDDGSPDGTGEASDAWAARTDRVQVIHRPGKLGLGTAYIAGFKYALAADYDRILTMDADFSHHPRYVSSLLALSAERDMVIGSRYVPGGGTLRCTWKRRALSQGANTFAKLMLGLDAKDCTAGFRCYRREVLEAINLDAIFSNGYSFLIELIFYVQRAGYRVGEVPIIFEDRRRGTTKISRNEVWRSIQTVGRLSIRRWREKVGG